MKPLYVLLAVSFFYMTNVFTQVQFSDHYNFTAKCSETSYDNSNQVIVYTHQDSVILDILWPEQCCAKFSLKINSEPNDTIFLQLSDTAMALCDCMCTFKIRINAGIKNSGTETVNFNGKNYQILDEDYRPLVQVGKKWNVMNLIPGLENSFFKSLKYSIDKGDGHYFCWNGKSYLKVNTSLLTPSDGNTYDTVPKYIREENGKVFQLDSSDLAFDGCNEFLLYDFTAKSGDIVYLGYDSIPFEVNEKGIDEETGRRYWILSDISQPYPSESSLLPNPVTKWIEGIGDLRGIFESKKSLFIDGSYSKLACCHINDSLLYQDSDYPECGERPPYNFIIEDGKEWAYVTHCGELSEEPGYTRSSFEIDTSNFEDNPYAMRFYPYGNTNVYYSEENGRVYYNDNEKFLIYDFTLNAEDSILVEPNTNVYLYVDSTKYLEYEDGSIRKTLYLHGNPALTGLINRIWVEGIGDLYNPLFYWQPVPTNYCFTEFACCSLSGNLIYHNPEYPDCGLNLAQENTQQQSPRIYPNPTNGQISLEYSEDFASAEYALYSLSGKLVQKGDISKTLLLNVPSGAYVILISVDNTPVYRDILFLNE